LEWSELFLREAAHTSFIWVPIVFAAFAISSRRVGIRFLLLFTAVEALAISIAIWIHNGGWKPSWMWWPWY